MAPCGFRLPVDTHPKSLVTSVQRIISPHGSHKPWCRLTGWKRFSPLTGLCFKFPAASPPNIASTFGQTIVALFPPTKATYMSYMNSARLGPENPWAIQFLARPGVVCFLDGDPSMPRGQRIADAHGGDHQLPCGEPRSRLRAPSRGAEGGSGGGEVVRQVGKEPGDEPG